jgi:hypothetical protein
MKDIRHTFPELSIATLSTIAGGKSFEPVFKDFKAAKTNDQPTATTTEQKKKMREARGTVDGVFLK